MRFAALRMPAHFSVSFVLAVTVLRPAGGTYGDGGQARTTLMAFIWPQQSLFVDAFDARYMACRHLPVASLGHRISPFFDYFLFAGSSFRQVLTGPVSPLL